MITISHSNQALLAQDNQEMSKPIGEVKENAKKQEDTADSSKFVGLVILNKKKINLQQGRSNGVKNTALCSKCGKAFSSNYNLKRHMTSCKLCPDREKAPRFQCDCGRTYTQEWDMKKHKSSCQDNPKKCKKCPFCNLLFYHKLQLQAHMKSSHNVSVQEPEVHEFQSIEDFKLWKEEIEEATYTYYSKQTGSNVTGVSVNTYYVCQHDGSDRVHGSSARKTDRRNKKGRIKTGQLCWSQMNAKEYRDGTVRVTYHPSHTHLVTASDTKHHPLPPSINNEIERRISQVKHEPDANDPFPDETNVEPSTARKRNNMTLNVRSLRALARKNRKLFRITAEAIQGCEEQELNQLDNISEIPPSDTSSQEDVVEQMPVDPPLPVEACSWYCDQLKSFCQSGNLSAATLSQMEMVLADLVENCRQDEIRKETELAEEVKAKTSDTIDFSEHNIYQVVALRPKDEPLSPLPAEQVMYRDSVDRVGHCEFIIITNASDHSQVFQSAEQLTENQ